MEEDEMRNYLVAERDKCNLELTTIEETLKALKGRGEELRKKVAAFDTILGSSNTDLAGDEPEEAELEQDADDGVFTPVQAYWKPILQAIVNMGGKGRRRKITDAVGEAMANILTPADHGNLPKSGWLRWRNRVQWQASEMRKRGLIRKDSPRGIWEISDEGRRWLDDKNNA